ncbi:hypothetical protein [Campylobacter sp.]|uniref:hypothetical protein n=1 Tax=Campylobacter sp. TaxID=205 RepID=UPI002A4FFD99|nr:hypothetical protein [Campylobacter sp.]MDD7091006.1 hypothetical protein [Campylobacteraceae bacterium]MDY5285516.1 hypothetical protein [Campylobacter sp.]
MEALRRISAYLIYSSSLSPDEIAQFETKEKAKIEIRSFYNGRGELKIKELVLYKID